jgi:hypothetical protein
VGFELDGYGLNEGRRVQDDGCTHGATVFRHGLRRGNTPWRALQ